MAAQPTSVRISRQNMGAAHNRSICINGDNSGRSVQQPVSRPHVSRGGCICTDKLALAHEFCECPIPAHQQSVTTDSALQGGSNRHSTMVASTSLASTAAANVDHCTNTVASRKVPVSAGAPTDSAGAMQKLKVADVRMEDFWKDQLLKSGWSERAAQQARFAWADSTRTLYNRFANRLKDYCLSRGTGFPPDPDDNALLANFFL